MTDNSKGQNDQFICTKCLQSLPRDKFHKNKSRKSGINSICKEDANRITKEKYYQRKEREDLLNKINIAPRPIPIYENSIAAVLSEGKVYIQSPKST